MHSEPAPLPGYEVEELVWEVEHTPGKPPAKLRGTIEEIHDQILDINPDFKPHEEDTSPAVKRGDGADALANLSKRKYQVICNHFPQTDKEKVELGIEYLRKVKGRPWLGPGPGKCIRVSCGYDAAIWWCNDVSTGYPFAYAKRMLIASYRAEQGDEDPPQFHQHRTGCFCGPRAMHCRWQKRPRDGPIRLDAYRLRSRLPSRPVECHRQAD